MRRKKKTLNVPVAKVDPITIIGTLDDTETIERMAQMTVDEFRAAKCLPRPIIYQSFIEGGQRYLSITISPDSVTTNVKKLYFRGSNNVLNFRRGLLFKNFYANQAGAIQLDSGHTIYYGLHDVKTNLLPEL